MTRRRHRHGFMLIDIIAALALLATFALIAAPLFNESMNVIERAPAAQDAMTRFESVSQTLREDAWGARSFAAVEPDAIVIDVPGQAAVRWQIDSDGDIERIQGDKQRRWIGVGAKAALEIEGSCVVLRSTSRAADDNGEIRCISVLQLDTEGGEK